MSRFSWIAASVYGLVLITLCVSLFAARRYSTASFGTTQARQEWDQWRAAARRQDGAATPVERRVPSSAEPPTLVLLRDHFATILAGACLITSALYWSSAILVRGVLFGPRFEMESKPDRDRCDPTPEP